MHWRCRHAFLGPLAALVALCLVGLTGCSTTSSAPFPGRGPGQNESFVYFEIQSTSRNIATIYINGEDRGDTPVRIRAEADAYGLTLEDMVIKAVWDGGGNDIEYTIPRGSRPQPIVKIGPNGSREF